MNKVFKIIWNNVTHTFIVVSELAKRKGKLSSERRSLMKVNSQAFKLSTLFVCIAGSVSFQVQAKFAQGGILDSNVNATSIAIADANSTATAANSITMGNSAKNPYFGGIVLGNFAGANSSTSGVNNVIIGGNSQVGTKTESANQSIAIGSGDVDKSGNIINGAWAKGDQSIAIGGNTRADGNSSIAIGGDDLDRAGSKSYTGEDKFIDYDKNGNKTGEYTLKNKALRDIYNKMTGDSFPGGVYSNTVSGEASVAIGVQAVADADLSTALGTKSKANALGSVALGVGAKANKLNSVAIGAASVTDKVGRAYATHTILGDTYTWAGGSTVDAGDVVSFGSKGFERQLINVAPGDISSNSTDAINGSQLYGVISSLEKIRYFSVKSSVAQNRNNDGASATDAIAIGPNASSTADRGIAVGLNSQASQPNTISLGWNAKTSAVNSIALGSHSEAGSNEFDATSSSATFKDAAGADTTIRFAASSSTMEGAVSVGKAGEERQIHNVAAGRLSATSTDAINGSQLYTVLNNSGFNVLENNASKARINNNNVVNFKNGTQTTAVVTKTANGTDVTFNVNTTTISSDDAQSNASTPDGNAIAKAGDVVNAINNVRNRPITFTGNTGSTTKKLGESLAIKGDGADITSAADTNNIVFRLNKSNSVAAGDNKVVTGDAVNTAINAINLNTAGNSSTGSVNLATQSLNITGTNGLQTEAKANGIEVKIDTATKNKIDNAANQSLDNINPDGKNVIKGLVDIENGKNTTANSGDVNGVKTFKVDVNTTTISAGDNGQVNTPANGDAPVTAISVVEAINNTYWNVVANDNTKEAVKAGNTVKFIDGKNISISQNGKDFTISTSNKVSFDHVDVGPISIDKDAGVNAGNNKVTNVQDGDITSASKDAVNGSQLYQTINNLTTKGFGLTAQDGNSVKKPLGETVEVVGADKNISTKVEDGKVKIALSKHINVDSVTAGDTKIDKDGLKAGDVSVTKAPITVNGTTVNNVNDAINQTAEQAFKALTFGGDDAAKNFERRLGEQIFVKGGATGTLSDNNIGVVSDGNGTLNVKLAKDLKDLDSADIGGVTINNKGIDMGDKKITGLKAGEDDTDAVNVSQLKKVEEVSNKGWNLTANGADSSNVKPGDIVDLNNTDKNINITKDGHNVTFNLAKGIKVDSVTAGDTVMNNDGVKVGDNVALNKNGLKAGNVAVTTDGVNAGNNKVTNVQDGDITSASKDAVNG
ncbi:ESPR-type extended signal peptide-containing protein, partial [Pasteurella bettyae]|uniref:ESPR-type extended signal peptide-containing protein n=1 Tax=Pasteurella bettyae TaxID=752 RepID=UPI003D2A27C5